MTIKDVQGANSTIRMKVASEPVKKVFPISPVATDEASSAGSSDKDGLEAEDESGTSSASLVHDDIFDDGKGPLLLGTPPGCMRRKCQVHRYSMLKM